MAIEKMAKVIVGSEYDASRDVRTLLFGDRTALFVSGEDMDRRGVFKRDCAIYLPGCTAHMELVDGKWRLARIDEPEGGK